MLLVEITTQALNQYKNLSAVSWTQKDEERMLLVLLYELLWGESLWVLRSICVSWMWTVDIKHETHAGTHVSFTAAGHHTGVSEQNDITEAETVKVCWGSQRLESETFTSHHFLLSRCCIHTFCTSARVRTTYTVQFFCRILSQTHQLKTMI